MSHFRGHDYRQDHFKAPRQIDGYYPKANKDAITGRWALAIAVMLLVLYAIGVNL